MNFIKLITAGLVFSFTWTASADFNPFKKRISYLCTGSDHGQSLRLELSYFDQGKYETATFNRSTHTASGSFEEIETTYALRIVDRPHPGQPLLIYESFELGQPSGDVPPSVSFTIDSQSIDAGNGSRGILTVTAPASAHIHAHDRQVTFHLSCHAPMRIY